MITTLILSLTAGLQATETSWPHPPTAEAYYAAINLLDVMAEPEPAHRAFMTLARSLENSDPPAHGARAMALAQAYRALNHQAAVDGGTVRDSLAKQALDLAQGTAFEAEVKATIDLAENRSIPRAQQDPSLEALVREKIDARDYDVLRQYGPSILPYLAPYLGSGNTKLSGRNQARFKRALTIGLSMATPDFIHEVGLATAGWGIEELREYTGGFEQFRSSDSRTRQAWDEYLVKLSQTEDPAMLQWAGRLMGHRLNLRRSKSLEKRLLEIFAEHTDVAGPVLVREIAMNTRDGESYEDLFRVLAVSDNRVVSQWARRAMLLRGWSESLELMAREGGAEDRLRLALAMYPGDDSADAVRIRMRALNADNDKVEIPHSLGYGFDTEYWEPWLQRFLQDSDADVRWAGATVAAVYNVKSVIRTALLGADAAVTNRVVQILGSYKAMVDADLLPRLFELGRDLGPYVGANKVLHANQVRMNHEQLLRYENLLPEADYAMKQDRSRDGAVKRFESWKEFDDGVERIARWALEPRARSESRHQAYMAIRRSFDTHPQLVIEAAKALEGEEALKQAASDAAHGWLNSLASQILERDRVREEDTARFLELTRFVAEHRSDGVDDCFSQVFRVLEGEPEGAMDLLRTLTADPNLIAAAWSECMPRTNSLARYRALEHFIQIAPPSLLRPNLGAYWSRLFTGHRHGLILADDLIATGEEDFIRYGLEIYGAHTMGASGMEAQIAKFLDRPGLALRAAEVLTRLENVRKYIPELVRAWNLEQLEGRDQFARVLGRLDDDRIVDVLLESINHTDDRVRSNVMGSLSSIRKRREERQAWEAWKLTGGSGSSPVAALIGKLNSSNRAVRLAAIQSLGTLKAKEALPILVNLLEDQDEEVVAAASVALDKING